MRDLTQGSIPKALIGFALFVSVSMVFQTLYFLADLYWVGHLGKDAVAAVGLAGNLTFIVLALTQMLGVGTTTLISHAAGQKDQAAAQLAFDQSTLLSLVTGLAFMATTFALKNAYCSWLAASPSIRDLAGQYLSWFIPAMFLQFGLVSIGAGLRGTGIIKPTVLISSGTVLLNIVLAPMLIFGWPAGHKFGIAGAAIASFIALAFGVLGFVLYFVRHEKFFTFENMDLKPHAPTLKRLLVIGVPAGAEFILMSVYLISVYWVIRGFGPAAQAGFGIGARVMQSLFLPVVAVAFATAPIAGQNFGAKKFDRVRQTFKISALIAIGLMGTFTILCQLAPNALLYPFSSDPAVQSVGMEYLRIISWNFVAAGLSFVASSMFQALGNTLPAFLSSCSRLLIFLVPVLVISHRADFQLRHVWYISLASVLFQCVLTLSLLAREFNKKAPLEEARTAIA